MERMVRTIVPRIEVEKVMADEEQRKEVNRILISAMNEFNCNQTTN